MIEDQKKYDQALTYIRKLNHHEADRHLQRFSKTLLLHLPERTTEVLSELCTGNLGEESPTMEHNALPFAGNESPRKSRYTPPSPRKFMPAFVDRPDCLTQFLETVFDKVWSKPSEAKSPREQEERKTIWNTLLELYLMQPDTEARQKALHLLKDETIDYDTNQALVLCQLKGFDEGIVYLYEKTGMYTDILHHWMEKGSTERVIEGVRKYGPKDASLYPMVLTYFSSSPDVMAKSKQELLFVMKHIDEKDLLPPIQVVQALSRSNIATIGLIKNYVGKKIEYERKELKQNEELIESYRQETEKRRKQIED
ncbi:hypothetical protein G6F56_011517 [Rhizopus delemar]|nr:hypothetical protein G6F56_011517 [Rhizopus delemar]